MTSASVQTKGDGDAFRVEPWADWLGGFVAKRPRLWRRIGNFETKRLGDALEKVEITAPLFVCGLARSGSTILLEILASHPDTATHRYRDYPGVLAPVFWDRIARRLYAGRDVASERAHGDGIVVTPDSPEAIEEMLWMAFYPGCHDPAHDNRIGRGDITPEFADFYRDHLRKILWLRDGQRYLSKGNYNVARLAGLVSLFPDARFVVPLRDPVAHVASLMRQHTLFSEAEKRYPAALRYLQRVGHYEFGLDRRPLNLGQPERTIEVARLWQEGREVEGWSCYWASLHDYLADLIEQDAAVAKATLPVRFEELCADPDAMLQRIFAHVGLGCDDERRAALAARIHAPTYYKPPFDEAEQQTIRRLTAEAAARLGY